MTRLLLTLLFVLSLGTCVRAQSITTDSLRFERYAEYVRQNGWTDSLARKRLDTLNGYAKVLGSLRSYAMNQNLSGDYYRFKGEPDTARSLLQSAIVAHRQLNDSAAIAKVVYNLARTYLPTGDYESAFTHYEDALYRFRNLGDKRMEIASLNALGVVLRRSQQPDRALKYYEDAYERSKSFRDTNLILTALTNRAIVHKRRKEFSQAISLYEEGLSLNAQSAKNDPREAAYLNLNLSSCYSSQKQPEAALLYARRAYDWFGEHGSVREKSMNMIGLAVNYRDVGQPEQSIDVAREALRVVGMETDIASKISNIISNGYSDLGVTDSAVYYLNASHKIANRLADKSRTAALDELEAKFQTREKQLEIERLEEEEILSAQRLRRRGYILVGSLAALVLLGWLLWRNLRQRRLIEDQNGIITKALGEKELLLKEIHHRVKNNLQMVSSLLNMQTHYIEDAAAADALQLGRSRVRSMALIHQKLYMGDEVSTLVDAKDYLERLAREILDTHAPPETKVRLQLDVEPLDLDIDTLVPLGLLTNEAVTNAVKYAFAGRAEGSLKVRLWHRDGQHTLTVSDDGPGLHRQPGTAGRESFGQLLMTTLAEQLEGTLETKDEGEGVEVVLRF